MLNKLVLKQPYVQKMMLKERGLMLSTNTIRIATRKSPLAMQQTMLVKQQLLSVEPSLNIEIVPFQTQGDKFLNQSLSKIGGKGLFVKELEHALLNNEADLAVHSMKDLPYELPQGLEIGAILKREDTRDALISRQHLNLQSLPSGATIGTSSLRRASQIKALRADLNISPLRGNINTRLDKSKNFDAIILAVAGLKRMNFDNHITEYLTIEQLLPAAGQGALGLECRSNDLKLLQLLKQLECTETTACVLAERGVIEHLHGSCQVPLAAHAIQQENKLSLKAMIATDDGKQVIHATAETQNLQAPTELGHIVAKKLLAQGAQPILDRYAV